MAKNKSVYSIQEVVIILPTQEDDDTLVDVRANVLEINFFENLAKPYVDARIAILDDFGLKNTLNLQGTERIRITIGGQDEAESPIIQKTFFIGKISDTKRLNERSEVISMDLVEEHVFVNAIKQISRSFSTTIEDVITDLCENELGKSVVPYLFNKTAQGVRKIIVPYLSPLEAVQWIKTRATSRTGAPIYLYGDLYSNNLYLSDLDSLLSEQESLNLDLPYRYSTAGGSADDKDESLRPYYEIISYREMDAENTLMLYEEGVIGSSYTNLDVGTGVAVESHLSVRDILDEFYTNELISVNTAQSIFDPSLVIDGRLSDEYNSLHINQITSSNTYNQYPSIHEETIVLDENGDIIESRLKVKNKIIRMMMKRNQIDIGVNGKLFFEGKIPVGAKLRVLFLNPDVSDNKKDPSQQLDRRKSGDYLILATNHKLVQENHNVVLRLTKLGELPRDFTL